ncbi:hypothetical protein IQ07DRAFT_58808 [Pyrenochaeta sp. DS3sAY3a]|nr:hypothetical protein IQ07DRAFT_58808 [Pyrenochaeta sp. DS3sAY3a]
MFRLLNLRRDKSEKHFIDIPDEPARPRTAKEIKGAKSARPRSISVSATATSSHGRRPATAKLPVTSTHRQYPGLEIPHLTQTPWEVERHKRNSTWKRSNPTRHVPANVFRDLPREVYDCILAQIEQLHLKDDDRACSSCYLNDLYSLSLTSRTWDKAARSVMYSKVTVLTNEDHNKLPKLRIKGTSRLKLLRRTLRERPALARQVRELHLSDFQVLYENASIEREEIVNIVASLVMACPYMERIVGFHIPFAHGFDRLSHALSTRTNLKERVWLLSESDTDSDEEDEGSDGFYHEARDPTERFLDLNSRQPLLSTLVLHQEQDQNSISLNFRAIVGTFRQFPVLRNLSISGLPANSFTNLALNALPRNLSSLRLENLPGINDKGLQRFTTSDAAVSIQRLTLINLEITSLITLSNILSCHLAALQRFTLIQDKAPGLSSRSSITDFHSPSLKFLHWEIRSQAGPPPRMIPLSSEESSEAPSFPFTNSDPICCLATSLLATGIKDGAFPSLRRIRIPHDPQGTIQNLCKPAATALLPADTAHLSMPHQLLGFKDAVHDKNGPRSPNVHSFNAFVTPNSPRADSAFDSPISSASASGPASVSGTSTPSPLTPLRSRLAAHSRILAARTDAAMSVRIFDPDGVLRLERRVGGFIGQIGSRIAYDLVPDARCGGRSAETHSAPDGLGSARSEWVVGIEDMVGEKGGGAEEGGDGTGDGEKFRGVCGHLVGGREGGGRGGAEKLF